MPVKVSVCMITYNHEQFIAQAIESIMMQKTNFDYELIIGEDCSTDNTRSILLDFKSKYPDKIKLFLHERNVGMMSNFIGTLKACDGKYIALCEGDDYWTDANKLQRQADFLDNNPDYSISFHKTIIRNETDGHEELSNLNQKATSTIYDILLENYICTASCVFRNGLIKQFPDFFYTTGAGDWVLHILNAYQGKIGYLNKPMAVYRIHEGGTIYNAVSSHEKLITAYLRDINTFNSIDKYFNFKFNSFIKKNIAKVYRRIALIYIKSNNPKMAREFAFKSLRMKFNILNALYLLPLALSPNPQKAYSLLTKLRG